VAAKTTKTLNARQEAFVREYLVDLNAGKAAVRAGYSERTSRAIGYELLQNPLIAACIAEAQAERAKRVEITADTVLQDIEAIKRDAMTAEKTGMRNHAAALKAAELQGRHLGMWIDKTELTGQNGGPLQITEIVRRVVDPKADDVGA
jgi:phage terminase small subunit